MNKAVGFKNDDRYVQRIKVTAIIADGKEFPIDPVICEGSVSLKCEMLDVVKFEPHDSVEVSEAHAHIAIDNATNGEYMGGAYSHLIGKFVRCIKGDNDGEIYSTNKWYKVGVHAASGVVGVYDNLGGESICTHDDKGVDSFWAMFDVSNPSDTNPDEPREVKALFDASRIAEAVRIETRDGREVKCVVVNDVEAEYPVTGYVNGGMLTWTNDGRFSTTGAQRPLDLFMVVKEVRND